MKGVLLNAVLDPLLIIVYSVFPDSKLRGCICNGISEFH